MFRSVRARLALSMMAVTAILAVVAVTTASSYIRNDLEQDALLNQNQEILALYALGDLPVGVELEEPPTGLETVVAFEPCLSDAACAVDCIVLEDGQCLAEVSAAQSEILYYSEVFADIASSPNADEIATALGTDPRDPIQVRLFLSEASVDYRVSFKDETIEPVEIASADPSKMVVSADSLTRLLGTSFDPAADSRTLDVSDELAAQQFDTPAGPLWFLADVSSARLAAAQVQRIFMVGSVLLTLFSGLAAWLLAARALGPVNRITKQVSSITAGSMHERVPEPGTGDEIDRLAATMNGMLARLETDDKRRRQFVSDAAHELRTPVAVLTSEAEVTLRAPEPTDTPRFARSVLAESNRMGGLVEDLLTLARLDESRQPQARQVADLDELVIAETDRCRRLPIDISAVSAGRVLGHTDELNRVVLHLLDNASRHGHSQVAVGVQANPRSGRVRFWVDDDGDGIAEEDRERVFERFLRLQEARDRDSGGSGLGLAVVSAIVTSLGGTIEAAEAPKLGGARISVELPSA